MSPDHPWKWEAPRGSERLPSFVISENLESVILNPSQINGCLHEVFKDPLVAIEKVKISLERLFEPDAAEYPDRPRAVPVEFLSGPTMWGYHEFLQGIWRAVQVSAQATAPSREVQTCQSSGIGRPSVTRTALKGIQRDSTELARSVAHADKGREQH